MRSLDHRFRIIHLDILLFGLSRSKRRHAAVRTRAHLRRANGRTVRFYVRSAAIVDGQIVAGDYLLNEGWFVVRLPE